MSKKYVEGSAVKTPKSWSRRLSSNLGADHQVLVREYGEEAERRNQRCGGGRRIIRKKIGGGD